jgi:hypothetical protein
MFDLLAEEDNISNYILNYVKCKLLIDLSTSSSLILVCSFFFLSFCTLDQQLFYKSALKEIETFMSDMNGLISEYNVEENARDVILITNKVCTEVGSEVMSFFYNLSD